MGWRKDDKFCEVLWHLRGILGRNMVYVGQTLETGLGAASSELKDKRSIAPRELEDSDKGFKPLGWG